MSTDHPTKEHSPSPTSAGAEHGDSAQPSRHFDVVICGGGLAGLTFAKQIRKEQPGLTVAVIERTKRPLPDAAHKVGESSVELGSQYLERLGLRDYLLDRHIVKYGLRFFPGGGRKPIEERTELAPSREPPVRSYQLDRGRFENDLREMVEAEGVELFEGYKAQGVTWGEGKNPHTVDLVALGSEGTTSLTAHWVVDATGRAALLRNELKLKRGSGHTAHAGWFRVKGRLDVSRIVPKNEKTAAWHAKVDPNLRWRSTNHFMGDGYWVWLIPLSTGNTSVGIVVHDEEFTFDSVRTLERCKDFLRTNEPYLADAIERADIMDFGCLTKYSHNISRCWSDQRWALIGEAGAFVDPLYSPGTDFIALANSFTAELIRVEQEGEDLQTRVRELNVHYRSLVMGGVGLYRQSSKTYGHARAMTTKIYWDNFSYWSFLCQYFQQDLYRYTGDTLQKVAEFGARFVELSEFIQGLCRQWAERAPSQPESAFIEMPDFPSLCVEAHLDLVRKMDAEQTFAYLARRLRQSEEIAAEIAIRVFSELGPEHTSQVMDILRVPQLALPFTRERLAIEELSGIERRKKMGSITRDIASNLGPVRRHDEWKAALAKLPLQSNIVPPAEPESPRELARKIAAFG